MNPNKEVESDDIPPIIARAQAILADPRYEDSPTIEVMQDLAHRLAKAETELERAKHNEQAC